MSSCCEDLGPVIERPAALDARQRAFPEQPIERRHQRGVRDALELRLQVANARRRFARPERFEDLDFERPVDRFELTRDAVLTVHGGVRLYWPLRPEEQSPGSTRRHEALDGKSD